MPDQPAHELSREVQRLLVVAADSGSPARVDGLREELGLGHSDLMGILDQLREVGMAVEIAPGEWQADLSTPAPPAAGDGGDSGRVRVVVPDAPAPEVAEAVLGGEGWTTQSVRLTRAMVEALDDEALGKLVRAGVSGSGGGFALEVW